MNIRVYKIIAPQDNTEYYIVKSKDGPCVSCVGSIGQIAEVTKRRLTKTLNEGAEQVSIDFTPFHDIEWATGLSPVRCFPLTEGEQEAFWLHFLKS